MCSHREITWEVVNNSVTDRMIDNSLIHKLIPSQIRKRTKILNAELKKHGIVKNYKQYVNLKTTLLRNLEEDYDIDINDLSDTDYVVIYSTPSTQATYVRKNSTNYIFASKEDSETNKRKKNGPKNKPSQTRRNNIKKTSKTQLSSKKHINVGWQNVIKKDRNTSYFFHDRTQANALNDKGNFSKDGDHYYLEAQSNNKSFNSEDSTIPNIIKSRSEQRRQNDEDSNVVTDRSNSQSDASFKETEPIAENRIQNYKKQSASLNKSNIELGSHLHYKIRLPKTTNLENNDNSHNETSIVPELEDSFNNELSEINNDSINEKNFSNTQVNRKSLENVRKNLISVLEEIDSTNNDKNTKKNESSNDELNYDKSPLTTTSRSNTPLKKTQIDVNRQDSSSSTLLSNRQKYSEYDKDLQNKFMNNEQFNLKSPISFLADIAEEILASPRCKKAAIQKEAKTDQLENSKQDTNEVHLKYYDNEVKDHLDNGKQNSNKAEKFSDEMRNSSRLDKIDKNVRLIRSVSQEDETDMTQEDNTSFVETESSCNTRIPQLLSPKENCIENGRFKSRYDIVNGQSNEKIKKKKSSKKRERNNSSKLDEDKDTEIYSLNHEDKADRTIDNVELEESHSIQKQHSLSPKNCIQNEDTESDNNILKELDSKEVKNSFGKREKRDSFQSNKDAKINLINHEDKMHSAKSENLYDSQKLQFLSPRQDMKNKHSESHNNISEMQNSRRTSESSSEKEIKDFPRFNEIDKSSENYSTNREDEMYLVKSGDSYDTQKQQQVPKITYTEIINKKYKIINGKTNDTDNNIEEVDNIDSNIITEDIPVKNDILTNCPAAVNHDADNWQKEMANTKEINNDIPTTLETDNEEDNTIYLSPQSKKRLQQQATLNLIVYSESSETSEENITVESSKRRADNFDTSHSDEDDTFKNDETSNVSKGNDFNGLRTEDSYKDAHISNKESIPVLEEIAESNLAIVQGRIKKKTEDKIVPTTESTYKNNLLTSNRYEDSLQRTENCENTYNNESSLLNKENLCNGSNHRNQRRDHISGCTDKFGNKSKSRQNTSVSTRNSRVEPDISPSYRPCNLQELVEDQDLLIETTPASFTLADLSEDDEAFILNIPSKVLQCSLQGQFLTLKENIIKFGKSKYKIAHKEMNNISCIFATGKKRKPYKTVNIKNVSTITARERLSHMRKSNSSKFANANTSFKLKSQKTSNRKINEIESKTLKMNKHKRKRSSDSNSEQSVTKKR